MNFNLELIGTLASFVVLVSFMMNKEKAIRIVNIVGASIFVVYGFLIGSFSVAFMNSALIVIHFWKLIRSQRNKTSKNTQ